MKIDIHTHTRKCKSGDAQTREISPERFCEIVASTDVGIVAITNHNVFDYTQFTDIKAKLPGNLQVWPGIELDITDGQSRAHLLVIVSPTSAKDFSEVVTEFTKDSTPDTFTATVQETLSKFDSFEPLYVAHYKQKKPDLSDAALEELTRGTKNPACVIKEVTNAISAGVYISHGHPSIYGSDVRDWAKYEEIARGLPDLRLPVESFEHFRLLLQKDPTTINTVLDRKTTEEIVLTLFDGATLLKLRAFNDINVIFGPKGTGKSCILDAIAGHYVGNGSVEAVVYRSKGDHLEETFDFKGRNLKVALEDHAISNCENEVELLRGAREVAITNVNSFVSFFQATETSNNAKKIRLKDLEVEDIGPNGHDFTQTNEAVKMASDFLSFLESHESIKREFSPEEIAEFTNVVSKLLDRLKKREWSDYSSWMVLRLLNSAIKSFRSAVARKTGKPAKPTTTGFREYALNRIKIEIAAKKIIKCVETKLPRITQSVGSLGHEKGELELWTDLSFQTGYTIDGSLSPLGVRKNPQKAFMLHVRNILKHAYSEDLFEHISGLNEEEVESVKSVSELLLFRRQFALNGKPYSPSSGESSMVMLHKELTNDKDIYILDEPERSLGNEYISEVIVPLIKERAKAGKKVFIATHDANIAVRTLPYSSIYRRHSASGYRTYVGNPFSNNLINVEDNNDRLDWKSISMKTLEGGEEAFGERSKIYGHDQSRGS